jgi:hypothetical protein
MGAQPSKWGPEPEGKDRMNTQLPVLRIVVGAAAALVLYMVVHAAVEALSRTATVLTGL